jgi:hypothetical protein
MLFQSFLFSNCILLVVMSPGKVNGTITSACYTLCQKLLDGINMPNKISNDAIFASFNEPL